MELRLKEYRKAHGMNQVEVAAILGVSSNYYAQLERGVNPMRTAHIELLAAHYGVRPTDLIVQEKAHTHASELAVRLQIAAVNGAVPAQLVKLLEIAATLDNAALEAVIEFAVFKGGMTNEQRRRDLAQ